MVEGVGRRFLRALPTPSDRQVRTRRLGTVGFWVQSPLGHIYTRLTCGYSFPDRVQISNAVRHGHGVQLPLGRWLCTYPGRRMRSNLPLTSAGTRISRRIERNSVSPSAITVGDGYPGTDETHRRFSVPTRLANTPGDHVLAPRHPGPRGEWRPWDGAGDRAGMLRTGRGCRIAEYRLSWHGGGGRTGRCWARENDRPSHEMGALAGHTAVGGEPAARRDEANAS